MLWAMPLLPITMQAGPFTLRPFEEKDVPSIIAASHDPLIPLITTVPAPCNESAALAFIGRQHERLQTGAGWSLAIAEGDAPALGQIGLWPGQRETASLGYWLLPSARGQGAAATALAALSRFGLGQFERLELYVEPWNEASWHTAERVGYRREGLMRKFQHIGGERRDLYLYSLLPGDLPAG